MDADIARSNSSYNWNCDIKSDNMKHQKQLFLFIISLIVLAFVLNNLGLLSISGCQTYNGIIYRCTSNFPPEPNIVYLSQQYLKTLSTPPTGLYISPISTTSDFTNYSINFGVNTYSNVVSIAGVMIPIPNNEGNQTEVNSAINYIKNEEALLPSSCPSMQQLLLPSVALLKNGTICWYYGNSVINYNIETESSPLVSIMNESIAWIQKNEVVITPTTYSTSTTSSTTSSIMSTIINTQQPTASINTTSTTTTSIIPSISTYTTTSTTTNTSYNNLISELSIF